MKEYPEAHQHGIIFLENVPEQNVIEGDFGIQVAKDGRVWVCVNDINLLRFLPCRAAYDTSEILK